MILNIFSRTIFGYVIGNIISLFKRIFLKEKVIWKSKFYFKYVFTRNKKNKDSFVIIILLIILTTAGILAMNQGDVLVRIWGLFIGGFGIIILYYSILRYLDRLYMLEDRLEIRILFYTYKVIRYNKIRLILRDVESDSNLHIIYAGDNNNIEEIGNELSVWEISSEVLTKGGLKIDPAIIHPNVYRDFEDIQKKLPESPIIKGKQKRWSEQNTSEKLIDISLFIINPITLTSGMIILFGINFINIYSVILFDITARYFSYMLSVVGNKNTLDYSVLSPR